MMTVEFIVENFTELGFFTGGLCHMRSDAPYQVKR
jgi:hypothetical protein